mgnify:CR=1 FL=1
MEFQLYVRQDFRRMGVGLALWSLMRDMMEVGSRREVFARVDIRNPDAIAFLVLELGEGILRSKGGAGEGVGRVDFEHRWPVPLVDTADSWTNHDEITSFLFQ